MQINFYILLPFISLNLFFLYYFDNLKIFHQNIDKPDSIRKLHKKPVPLAGGIIIFFNILLYSFFILFNDELFFIEILFANKFEFTLFLLSCFAIFLLGFLDDRFNISPSIKFFTITIIILSIIFFDQNLIIDQIKFSFLNRNFDISEYAILFTCFCFLVFINAFNMFDGINLQSCFYSIIIFLSILFFYIDLILIQIFIIALVSYGFLNSKNKSFLGDSGSLVIPFIISYIFIKLYNFEIINFSDEIVIYMLIPGLDLIRLFFKRISQKRNPLSPDRFHLHHLLLLKFSHNKTLVIILILIIIPILLNFLGLGKLYIIIISSIIYSIIIMYSENKKKL